MTRIRSGRRLVYGWRIGLFFLAGLFLPLTSAYTLHPALIPLLGGVGLETGAQGISQVGK